MCVDHAVVVTTLPESHSGEPWRSWSTLYILLSLSMQAVKHNSSSEAGTDTDSMDDDEMDRNIDEALKGLDDAVVS